MRRRGEISTEMLVVIGIALLAFFIAMYFIYSYYLKPLNDAGKCGMTGRSVCMTSCDPATHRKSFESLFNGCTDGKVCCAPIYVDSTATGTAPPTGAGGPVGPGSSTPVKTIPTPGAPTILIYEGSSSIAAAREVQIVPGSAAVDPVYTIVERIGHHDCVTGKGTICPPSLTLQVVLRNARGYVVDSYDTDLNDLNFLPSGIPSIDSRAGMIEVGKVESKFTPDPKDPVVGYTMVEFTVTPHFEVTDAGQRYQLSIQVVPDPALNKPGLAKQQTMNFNVLNPIKIAGLTPQITKKKDIQVSCDSSLKCTDMYFKLETDPKSCALLPDPSAVVVPSTVTKYCPVDFTTNNPACNFDSQAACDASLGAAQDTRWLTAAQYASNAFDQGGDLMLAGQQLFGASNSVNIPICVAKTTVTSGPGPFKIASYTAQNPKGTIILDYDAAKNKYLCVYGKNAQGTQYMSVSQQKILLDLQPPVLTAKFDPLTLTVKADCKDEGQDNSGCKTTIGYAYISDLASYSQTLFRGPKSAPLYCLPFQTSGGYTSHPYYTINTANSNEVRVMCIRTEDNAGNAAVTMVTIFNSYDLLAKSVAMAMRRR